MMIIRRSDTLGTAHSGGQLLRCHFAFSDYQEAEHTHEGCLQAVNIGTMLPNGCYQIGPEAAVDILTWVRSGIVTTTMDHFQSEDIGAGGLHLISSGTGCRTLHWKAGGEGVSFIQFWILPDIEGTTPMQESRPQSSEDKSRGFQIIASGFPEDDPEEQENEEDNAPITLNARARLLQAALPAQEGAAYCTTPGRDLYMLVVSGSIRIGEETLFAGDAAAFEGITDLTVIANQHSELLLADVAADRPAKH